MRTRNICFHQIEYLSHISDTTLYSTLDQGPLTNSNPTNMPKFPTIESFFSLKNQKTPLREQIPPGDGFAADEYIQGSRVLTNHEEEPNNENFHPHGISSLRLGMKNVSITGRVVNVWEGTKGKTNPEGKATRLFQISIKDDSGIIEVLSPKEKLG